MVKNVHRAYGFQDFCNVLYVLCISFSYAARRCTYAFSYIYYFTLLSSRRQGLFICIRIFRFSIDTAYMLWGMERGVI